MLYAIAMWHIISYMPIEPQFTINNNTKIYSSSIVNQLNIIDIIWMIDTSNLDIEG